MSEYSSSADEIAANDDVLTEILIRLPVKPLMQFKLVSKHWFYLITAPHFARCRNPVPSSVSGLFLYSSMRRGNHVLNFIPLQKDGNLTVDAYSKALTLTTFPGSAMSILSSCCGLLCCSSFCDAGSRQFHVLNPTTKQLNTLPTPTHHHDDIKGLSLVFDPSRSPHYKVIRVWGAVSILSTEPYQFEFHYHIEIYSSETGTWRPSGDPYVADHNTQFLGGVYWNGAIHWFNIQGDSLYFKVEEEQLGIMPMPPIPSGDWKQRSFRYYGESRGHLHLVEIYTPMTQFSVYEMERDYSGWFVKYRIDIEAVGAAFPEVMQRLSWDPMFYSFAILGLVHEEKDEGSFLVLHVPGKVIRYNLADKSVEEICDVAPEHCDNNGMIEDSYRYFWSHAFQYIETVYSI